MTSPRVGPTAPVLRRRWAVVVAAGAVATALLPIAPARAGASNHYTVVEEKSVVVDWCGADVPFRNDFRVTMTVTERSTGREGTFHLTQVTKGVAVWTNLATRRSITITWAQHTQDVKVTLDGNTLSVLFQIGGNATISDPDGRKIDSAPGMGRSLGVLDDNGRSGGSECDIYREATALP